MDAVTKNENILRKNYKVSIYLNKSQGEFLKGIEAESTLSIVKQFTKEW